MASDEIIWQIINQQFCSFKLKTEKKQNFCRNEYNVTGLCNRQSCPLANSRYATVRQHPTKQTLYLYMKTVERAHLPSRMWQKIKLSNNYTKALGQIDEHLVYWPKFLLHKCKQRLTRLTQVQIRMRRIAAEEERLGEKLVPKLAPKIKHREEARERKAEAAAKLERTIERELVERLRQGAYGDQPLNVSENIWKKVLNAMERDGQGERDEDLDEGVDSEEQEEGEDMEDGDLEVQYVSDVDGSEAELDELEDWLESDNDEEEDEEEEDDSEAEEEKVGAKRKRGHAVRTKAKKAKQEKEKLALTNDLAWHHRRRASRSSARPLICSSLPPQPSQPPRHPPTTPPTMASWYTNILTRTTSQISSLRSTLLASENDGDSEDDTHVCRVLRNYYGDKGRRLRQRLWGAARQGAGYDDRSAQDRGRGRGSGRPGVPGGPRGYA
ncbi:Mak16 protein [Metarhizium album ARSEF 1941]|uniref:Mak16 protein n=1 Tax=Metarhizium album (strain ARSEF 1941) TaxID=1081103 RepID=A0A0B2WI39_METAS|nr:Mak16 protein [Metarhizium album ARSEF 1941]KHN95686.1 Mak16 protein [Metarhizium album ARSEF 1941]